MLSNLLFVLMFIGGFCLVISIGYILLMCFLFLVNKFLNKSTMTFREYASYWAL